MREALFSPHFLQPIVGCVGFSVFLNSLMYECIFLVLVAGMDVCLHSPSDFC